MDRGDRLIIDADAQGRVSVVAWPAGELLPSPAGDPFELRWPLDVEALEDLRWYLEDYLRVPFGVYEERGPQIEARLADWGEAVFGAVFGTGPVRDAYVRSRQSARPEVIIRSSVPGVLGLPWELLRDPSRPTPLALDGVGLTRSLPSAQLGDVFAVGGERLRVLMVISRPAGGEDVGYQMIARPLLRRLGAVRGEVDLEVLRPPTLEALGETLDRARREGRPFQVVHFDGHGVLERRDDPVGFSGRPVMLGRGGAEGVLVFERPEGGADPVAASRIAQVLKRAEVPLVVLNACQSGAVGKELEAAVATRLLQEGVASVVAMSYSVYAVAAAEFMAAFYERLFAGDTVTAAVGAGRRRLHERAERPSPKGDLPLADWIVPVHYVRNEIQFPYLQDVQQRERSLDTILDDLRNRPSSEGANDGELDPVGEFVGRDALFFELEVAARLQRVIVLHGPGGTGKTELAKAFGRWWRATGALADPEGVILHSFEPGIATFGLDGVIADIGVRLFGPRFAALDPDERRAAVTRALREHRLLLVWDNVETVCTMPDPTGATPPLDDAGLDELRTFLTEIADHGQSAVIVTSRTDEAWLGPVRRIPVAGLNAEEAIEYADALLGPYPAAQSRRQRPAFARLLEWLDGHPLSMRLTLPHLDATEPETLLNGLQGISPLATGDRDGDLHGGRGDRHTSLAASITYSFDHLPTATRGPLVAISLFHGVADADALGAFSQVEDAPERFRGLTSEAWGQILDDAAGVGLLTQLGAGMYRIHPALPSYLAAHWRSEAPDRYAQEHSSATRALLTAHAGLGHWLFGQIKQGDAALALTIIDHERRTLGHLLGYALDHEDWPEAQAIAQPFDDYFRARGLTEEARGWGDRARLALETPDGIPPDLTTSAGDLWLFFVGTQAYRELVAGDLDGAERTYRDVVVALESQADSEVQQRNLAAIYHQLGMVAAERARLDDAEDWYTRSLTIEEQLGNRPGMATSYHQLGRVAELRGRLDDAEDLYTRALTIQEQLGDLPSMAATIHQLGMVAQVRGRLDEAEDWYTRSLSIEEQLGNRPGVATSYHQLGRVMELRERLDEAEEWYTRSLAISEKLGDRPSVSRTYYQLGMVAATRGRTDDAEDWFTRSLTIREQLDDRPGMAANYTNLSSLAEQDGDMTTALESAVRAVALLDELPQRAPGFAHEQLARLTSQLGVSALENTWQRVTGHTMPQHVRDYVESPPPEAADDR